MNIVIENQRNFLSEIENIFEICFNFRNLTAEGAMVIGIVIGSGDLISRLELLLLPPLLWREDGTRIDLGARATDEFKVVEITIAPLPGSSCAGLAISTWSARHKSTKIFQMISNFFFAILKISKSKSFCCPKLEIESTKKKEAYKFLIIRVIQIWLTKSHNQNDVPIILNFVISTWKL